MESSVRLTALSGDQYEKIPAGDILDRNLANSSASDHNLYDLPGSLLQCLQSTGKEKKHRLSFHVTSIHFCITTENLEKRKEGFEEHR